MEDQQIQSAPLAKPPVHIIVAVIVVIAFVLGGYSFFFKKKNTDLLPSSIVTQKEKASESANAIKQEGVADRQENERQPKDDTQKNVEEQEVPVLPPTQYGNQEQGLVVPPTSQTAMKIYPMTVKTTAISVELAETRDQQERGLSGRTGLEKDRGLLYILPKPDFYTFWMKNMKFSIDIIWIDKYQKVVDITHSLSPDTYPRIFQPVQPAQIVLEVAAGFAEQNNIKIGDPITLPKIQ